VSTTATVTVLPLVTNFVLAKSDNGWCLKGSAAAALGIESTSAMFTLKETSPWNCKVEDTGQNKINKNLLKYLPSGENHNFR